MYPVCVVKPISVNSSAIMCFTCTSLHGCIFGYILYVLVNTLSSLVLVPWYISVADKRNDDVDQYIWSGGGHII